MQEPSSLVLEILRQDAVLKMSIFEKSELASTLRHYSQCAVSFAEIEKFCQEVIAILNKANKPGAYSQELIKGLEKTGQLLWEHLITRPVKEILKTTALSDLILSIDEELIDIPWELLFDGENFLCLNFNLGRVVRTKQQISQPKYRSWTSIPGMLILANPTNDLKSAYSEGVFIKNQFDRKRKEISIDFKSTNIDTLYVKKNLRDYDLVHFAGHCEYDSDNPERTGWVFCDGRFSSQDILTMGQTLSFPSLVFSNACYSAKAASEVIESDYQKKSYSLASAFLFSGVRHYIGAIRKIEDQVSKSFSKEFYTQLISGKPVGECIKLSRLKLIKEYGIQAIHWASYLLYGDPNFVLFRKKAKQQILKRRSLHLNKKRMAWASLSVLIIAISIYLYMWLPTINPNTYRLFLITKKLFQKGNNQEVISVSRSIIQKEPLFLAAYPLLADAYQRLGDRENALKCYFDYAFYSEKRQDKFNLCQAYVGIGWSYQLVGEYPKARDFYNKAIALSRENKDRLNEAAALRKLAVWHMDKDENDKALEFLTKSSEINREKQHVYEHRYNLACDYFNMGLLFTNKDDFVTAKEFYNKSLKLFEKLKLKNELSDYYFNLGEICKFEKQYQKALDCYSEGLKIDKALNNLASVASDYDMIGELYTEMGNFQEAEKYFAQAISLSRQIKAPMEFASANYNLGLLYKQKGLKDKARLHLQQAQEVYIKVDTPDYQDVKQELLSLD